MPATPTPHSKAAASAIARPKAVAIRAALDCRASLATTSPPSVIARPKAVAIQSFVGARIALDMIFAHPNPT